MRVLFSALFALVIGELSPPSQFSTDCKYVTATTTETTTTTNAGGNQTTTYDVVSIVVPIDACYLSRNLPISDYYSVKNSYQWKCELDAATNVTAPVHYQYIDTTCSMGQSAYTPDPPYVIGAYNCRSSIECPFAGFTVTERPGSCGASGTPTPESQYYFSTALNLCNNGAVFTCNHSESIIYEWTYGDTECAEYVSYRIYQETATTCQDTTEMEETITTCDMKDVRNPFGPTPPPMDDPTPAPSPPTAASPPSAPSQPSTASQPSAPSSPSVPSYGFKEFTLAPAPPTAPTVPTTQAPAAAPSRDNAPQILSIVVHLVVLFTCIFVAIQ